MYSWQKLYLWKVENTIQMWNAMERFAAFGADFEDYTKVIKINELLKGIHNIT